ncbi:hypothetical protein [Couchioplanes caeruleus]|uniref:Uncharacterized protein n=2 Tax=Couchioplanes caeruleus TaxID=56438 RepID=A0A1K0GIT9_9ACTN|nr:hypothetical protein [Couchioplanes caeruleus]OJF10844.1 hypothetical protein BG844_29650 [Couchioplanes caeruleus subsp. caeruleus]ROP32819.1 hypothetical protein EDD30_5767 [Couchioplanes caeruleus]
MNPEILDMAGGDSYRARAIDRLLASIADGPNAVLREMASGVRKGDLSLRDAASSSIYSEALADQFDTFWQRYQTLTAEEQQDLLAEGHRFIEQSEPTEPDEAGGITP